MIQRNLHTAVRDAMDDSPVILINGARQTGKSTLAKHVAHGNYITFDDAASYAAAAADPQGFITGLDGPVVLDEVQRVPALFRAIKLAVDRDRVPGRFLLTGSADVFMLPAVSESLAGRMEIHTLWPFSQGELRDQRDSFADRVFDGGLKAPADGTPGSADLAAMLLRGGYPVAQMRKSAVRRDPWFAAYVTGILQRDVRDIADIDNLAAMPRLLALIGARAGSLLNYAELSRTTGIPQTTLKRYCTILEATFLLHPLPAWSANFGKRIVKSPKVYLCDTGLAAHLTGANPDRVATDRTYLGMLLENFVAVELLKQRGWANTPVNLYHFRTSTGQEVDFILERKDGSIAGVEVKATETLGKKDFRHLEFLRGQLKNRFKHGVVLYNGSQVVPFGDRLTAVPLATLWQGPAHVN